MKKLLILLTLLSGACVSHLTTPIKVDKVTKLNDGSCIISIRHSDNPLFDIQTNKDEKWCEYVVGQELK